MIISDANNEERKSDSQTPHPIIILQQLIVGKPSNGTEGKQSRYLGCLDYEPPRHLSRHFSRSFELKSGADMTRLHMLHSPVPKSKTGHRQHSGAATNDHHRHVPLICVLRFGSNSSTSATLHHQVFPSHQDPMYVGVWDDDQPTCLIIPRSTDTAGAAVRSNFRYCVDDDSLETCHWA